MQTEDVKKQQPKKMHRVKKVGRQGFAGTLVGVSISFINAVIQFMMIYWILQSYGIEFNGFIRLTASLTVVGGSTEGALGIATVVLLMKPLANDDFITANEIFSTAKRRYRKGMIMKSSLVLAIAIFYPLYLILAPALIKGGGEINFYITLYQIDSGLKYLNVQYYQLVLIVFFFGIKNIITAGFFGAYENVIQADQQNGVRRIIILFTDLVIYGILIFLLNLKQDNLPISPIFPFMILMAYGPLRGLLISIYVKRNYHWIHYYHDFDNFQLKRTQSRIFWTSIGRNIIFSSDTFLIMFILGGYGTTTSSILSLYLIIGVNTRLIMTNFIISFREYFVSVLVKDGRLTWEAYSKYELYIYAVAAFTFVTMSVTSPYLVSGLYGQNVLDNIARLREAQFLNNLIHEAGDNTVSTRNINLVAVQNASEFMFQRPTFSILYAASTAFILLIQGQNTLVEAKDRVGQVTKVTNILAGVYLAFAIGIPLIFSIPQKGDYFIDNTLIAFYSIKLSFMAIFYAYLWIQNWNRGTYNSDFSHIFANFSAFALPVTLGIVLNFFVVQLVYPIAEMKSVGPLILMILIIHASTLGMVIIIALAIRPKVAISLVLMLPIVKQIVTNSKKKSRYKRLSDENIDLTKMPTNQVILNGLTALHQQQELDFDNVKDVDEVFKPKIYKLKKELDDD